MLNPAVKWAEDHPRVILFVSACLVAESIYSFHRVLSWAESLEQIEASEFFGG